MKRIAKKLCSTVCALLAFSGNRGGALTKEILCNAGQWLTCVAGCFECFDCFYTTRIKNIDGLGQKILDCSLVAATVGNAVDDAKKGSTNYWPILEAIFGVFQLAFTNHDLFLKNGCHFCMDSMLQLLGGSALLADAYFRYRESNQTNNSSNLEKNSNTNNIQAQKPKNEH